MRAPRASRSLAPLLFCGLALLANSCADQPRVQCTASRSTFAARYQLVSGTGPCAEVVGDLLGVQTFVPDPRNPGDGLSTVAIKSGLVGDKQVLGADANPAHVAFAAGKFTSIHPDGNDLCHINSMTVAEFERGPVATNRRLDPAIHVTYEWRNVRFLVTPAHTGVMFEADLTYTQDGCKAEYRVTGLSPFADCGTLLVPDQSKCSPEADGTKLFAGSGIAPEFATECVQDPAPPEPRWFACLPARPFPSFK